jgi:hypothetical protein
MTPPDKKFSDEEIFDAIHVAYNYSSSQFDLCRIGGIITQLKAERDSARLENDRLQLAFVDLNLEIDEAREKAEEWRNRCRPKEPSAFSSSQGFWGLPWETSEEVKS